MTTEDLETFLKHQLKGAVERRGAGLWDLPLFSILRNDQQKTVEIKWVKQPKFGPFVFDGSPFWRKKGKGSALPFECAGIFAPDSLGLGVVSLRPTSGYKHRVRDSVYVAREESLLPKKLKRKVRFLMANEVATRKPQFARAPIQCRKPVDLPLFSLVIWNTEGPLTKDPAFRQILTEVIPRGALLRIGTGSFGRLSSGIFSNKHFGFNSALRLYPFDIDNAAKKLRKMGFFRVATDLQIGRVKNGKPLLLRMHVDSSKNPVVEKVIDDSLASAGLRSQWSNVSPQGTDWDGYLTGISAPSPGYDYLADFHSKSVMRSKSLFPPLEAAGLNDALEQYALSLTEGKPSFDKLKEVHRLMYEAEPFTVLMQHRACLKATGGKIAVSRVKLNQRDPDWFRRLFYSVF